MKNLIKAEFECGAIVRKILLILAWLYFAGATIYQSCKVVRLTKGARRPKSDMDLAMLFAVILVGLTILVVKYCFRFSCVPYWNKKLSRSQLAEMLNDEEFSSLPRQKELHFSSVKVSDHWVKINGYLYSRELTAYLDGTAPDYKGIAKFVDATMIDGSRSKIYVCSYVWACENGKKIIHSAGLKSRDDYDNSVSEDDLRNKFSLAFDKAFQGKSYKDISLTNLSNIRSMWYSELTRLAVMIKLK